MTSEPSAPRAARACDETASREVEHAAAAPGLQHSAVKRTRVSAAWTALGLGFVILTVLLIFVAQNTESVQLDFLGWQGSLPLGVAILLAAVAGGLLTVAIGSVRIFQLRRATKRASTRLTD